MWAGRVPDGSRYGLARSRSRWCQAAGSPRGRTGPASHRPLEDALPPAEPDDRRSGGTDEVLGDPTRTRVGIFAGVNQCPGDVANFEVEVL
jgi:hypothetical protein